MSEYAQHRHTIALVKISDLKLVTPRNHSPEAAAFDPHTDRRKLTNQFQRSPYVVGYAHKCLRRDAIEIGDYLT